MAPDNDADEPLPGRGDPGKSETRHHPPRPTYSSPHAPDYRRRSWLLVAFVLAVLIGILAGLLWPDIPWIRN
jgi:hypothetical protein